MKAFIQLTNNRSCLLRADEIKADNEPRLFSKKTRTSNNANNRADQAKHYDIEEWLQQPAEEG